MNGKDIFRATAYIDPEYIAEAEFASFNREAFENADRMKGRIYFRRPVLIAAIIALMVMIMGCALALGVFADYFEHISGQSLTESQKVLLSQEEQTLNQAQKVGEWTVTLRSVLSDGTKGYIICGIAAPEGIDLTAQWDADGCASYVIPRNQHDPEGHAVVSSSVRNTLHCITFRMVDDGDGKVNTQNYVIELSPNLQLHPEPFGPEVDWYIHLEDIVRISEDKAYREELLNGKYQGQTNVIFTSEETKRLNQQEILTEGTWDFTVNFDKEQAVGIQLLTEPTQAKAWDIRTTGHKIDDFEIGSETVTMTSVIVRPLTVTIFYEGNISVSFTSLGKHAYAVMLDGSQIIMDGMGTGSGYAILEPRSPIVLEELDYILLPDGTKLYNSQ